MKHLLFVVAILWGTSAHAGDTGHAVGAGISAALQSWSDSLNKQIDSERELERQKALIEYQEKLRRERLEQDRGQQKYNQNEELQKLNSAHPHWRETRDSSSFRQWFEAQPESVKRLRSSNSADDAILLFDLYSRDTKQKVRTSPTTSQKGYQPSIRHRGEYCRANAECIGDNLCSEKSNTCVPTSRYWAELDGT